MAPPVWKYPGVWEGRISPVNSVAQGSEGYYYAYAYGYGYNATGESVFCLGEDRTTFQPYRMTVNDTILVQQTFTITAAQRLILFSFHMRTPPMPSVTEIISAGPVDFTGGDGHDGLIVTGDGCSGLRLANLLLASAPFAPGHKELWLRVAGATDGDNNGDHRITDVPWDQGDVLGGDTVLLENQNRLLLAAPDTAAMVGRVNDPAVTLHVLGLKWVSRAYVNWGAGWQEWLDLEEQTGHTWYRTDLAIHVSKYTGSLTLRFESKLELVVP